MKRFIFVLTFASLMMLSFAPAYGVSEIVLDDVTGLYSDDAVNAGCSIEFTFRLTNTDGNTIYGFCNGFRVWTHRYGAYTNNFGSVSGGTLPLGWDTLFDLTGGIVISLRSVDGVGEDTVGFGGSRLMGPGIPDGFDQQVWWVRTKPYDGVSDGDTLCIDSAWFPPGGPWVWATTPGGIISPAWYGPHCFHVIACPCGPPQFTNCVDSLICHPCDCDTVEYTFCADDPLSNPPHYPLTFRLLNGPGTINQISDTCAVWSYVPSPIVFGTSWSITVQASDRYNCGICIVNLTFTDCRERGNADGQGGINVADLIYLVAYLFEDGPAPPCCEEGNADGEGGVNVADLTYLVDYLFFNGPAPPPCP